VTILVTGSAGHLGEALMRSLRAEGVAARGLDIKPSAFTDVVGSITDRAIVRDALKGVRSVVHTATLHKPHAVTHSHQDFVDTNITGTLVLLEECAAARVDTFVYTSTTSAFGAALKPAPDGPASWITEDVAPVAKNIYGTTKLAAEGLCEMFARKGRLAAVVLRTSRFFPEADDDAQIRGTYATANVQANEMLYRRVDIADIVSAHKLALEKATAIGFRRYIISATSPFTQSDLALIHRDAPAVIYRLFPDCRALYAARGWSPFPRIDRVYVNKLARAELGWTPRFDFRTVLDCLRAGADFRSALARDVGSKGYHDAVFADGPYPV